MAEYIEREEALAECDWYANEFCEAEYAIMPLRGAIRNIPSADVQPVRHGRWTDKRTIEHDGEWYCSECNKEITIYMGADRPDRYRYCPNCGAYMGGANDS